MEPNPDGTVRLSVAPPSSGLARASGSVPTVAGPVSVSWQRRGAGVALAPDRAGQRVGAGAPAGQRTVERARGRRSPPRRAPGVSVYSVADGVAVLSVGSGSYRFTSA